MVKWFLCPSESHIQNINTNLKYLEMRLLLFSAMFISWIFFFVCVYVWCPCDIHIIIQQGQGATFSRTGWRMGWNIAVFWLCISSPNTQPLHISKTKKAHRCHPRRTGVSSRYSSSFLIYLLPVLTPSYPQIFILRPPITYTKQMC